MFDSFLIIKLIHTKTLTFIFIDQLGNKMFSVHFKTKYFEYVGLCVKVYYSVQ